MLRGNINLGTIRHNGWTGFSQPKTGLTLRYVPNDADRSSQASN